MAMPYEEALREWAARKLELAGRKNVDRDKVKVVMDFDEGYNCCGGTDPDCYCSMVEPPRANVVITAGRNQRLEISMYDFNFTDVLGEIVAAGGGLK